MPEDMFFNINSFGKLSSGSITAFPTTGISEDLGNNPMADNINANKISTFCERK